MYSSLADKEKLFLALLDPRCAERAQDLRAVFTGDDRDVEKTGRQTRSATRHATRRDATR